MEQPRHFTSTDLSGQRVWAVTLDRVKPYGYTVDARLDGARWTGTVEVPAQTGTRFFRLLDRHGAEIAQATTLRLIAEEAASMARRMAAVRSLALQNQQAI